MNKILINSKFLIFLLLFKNTNCVDSFESETEFLKRKFRGIISEEFDTNNFINYFNNNPLFKKTFMGIDENINYLDIGSGDGIVTKKFYDSLQNYFPNKKIEATAIEPDKESFNISLNNLENRIKFINTSIENLEKPEKPFNLISIFKYCIDLKNTVNFLNKLNEISSKNGIIIFTLIDPIYSYGFNKNDLLKNNPDFLLNQIPNNNFKIIKDFYYFKDSYKIIPNFRCLVLRKN